MGFLDDIWTVVLSDDHGEVDKALERISEDEVATAVARSALAPVEPPDADGELEALPSEPDAAGAGGVQGASADE